MDTQCYGGSVNFAEKLIVKHHLEEYKVDRTIIKSVSEKQMLKVEGKPILNWPESCSMAGFSITDVKPLILRLLFTALKK